MISWCAEAENVWCVSEWLSQTEMEPGLSALFGQMDPQSSTTVSAACFMSPAVLIFYTSFNSLPYNIRFSKPRGTRSNWFWNLSCTLVLRRDEVSVKHRENFQPLQVIFWRSAFKDTKSGLRDLVKFVTPCTICHSCTALYAKCGWALELKNSLWLAIYQKDMLY